MDRRVKERLIGASILVAIVVSIVPALLSGPKPQPATSLPAPQPEPTRNVIVDLATAKAPTSQESEPAADPSAPPAEVPSTVAPSAVTPSAVTPSAVTPSAVAPSAVAPSAVAPSAVTRGSGGQRAVAPGTGASDGPAPKIAPARSPPVESGAASPISVARGSWTVQLGSFASHSNAEGLMRQLRAKGFSAYIMPAGSGSAIRYRVRVGPAPNREAAERTAARLKLQGHPSSIVAPVS